MKMRSSDRRLSPFDGVNSENEAPSRQHDKLPHAFKCSPAASQLSEAEIDEMIQDCLTREPQAVVANDHHGYQVGQTDRCWWSEIDIEGVSTVPIPQSLSKNNRIPFSSTPITISGLPTSTAITSTHKGVPTTITSSDIKVKDWNGVRGRSFCGPGNHRGRPNTPPDPRRASGHFHQCEDGKDSEGRVENELMANSPHSSQSSYSDADPYLALPPDPKEDRFFDPNSSVSQRIRSMPRHHQPSSMIHQMNVPPSPQSLSQLSISSDNLYFDYPEGFNHPEDKGIRPNLLTRESDHNASKHVNYNSPSDHDHRHSSREGPSMAFYASPSMGSPDIDMTAARGRSHPISLIDPPSGFKPRDIRHILSESNQSCSLVFHNSHYQGSTTDHSYTRGGSENHDSQPFHHAPHPLDVPTPLKDLHQRLKQRLQRPATPDACLAPPQPYELQPRNCLSPQTIKNLQPKPAFERAPPNDRYMPSVDYISIQNRSTVAENTKKSKKDKRWCSLGMNW